MHSQHRPVISTNSRMCHHSRKQAHTHSAVPPCSPISQPLETTNLLSVTVERLLDISCKSHHTIFGLLWWLLFHNNIFKVHVVARISTSFFFMGKLYSVVWIDHILCIHSVDGHLGCFHFLAVTEKAAWTFVFKFLFEHLISALLGTPLGVELPVVWEFYG